MNPTRRGASLWLATALVTSIGLALAGAVGILSDAYTARLCLAWSLVWSVLGSLVTVVRWLRSAPLMAAGQFILLVGYGVTGVAAGMGHHAGIWGGLTTVAIGGPIFATGLMVAWGEAEWARTFGRHLLDLWVFSLAALLVIWRLSSIDGAGHSRPTATLWVALIMFGVLQAPGVLYTAERQWLSDSARGALGPSIFAVIPGVLVSGVTVAGISNLNLVRLACLGAITLTVVMVMLPRPPHVRPLRTAADAEGLQRTLLTTAALGVATIMVAAQFNAAFLASSLLILLVIFLVTVTAREALNGRERESLVVGLQRQAHRDELTSLGNRRGLRAQLEFLYQNRVGGTVVVLDVDRFKWINDEFGHARGDALLVALGNLLVEVGQHHGAPDLPDVTTFRLGGDEFVMAVPGPGALAEAIAEDVRRRVVSLSRTFSESAEFPLTASIGLAPMLEPAPDESTPTPVRSGLALPVDHGQADPSIALTRASRALRVAKRSRNLTCWFTEEFEQCSHRQAVIERRLRSVLTTPGDPGLSMHFQPIIEMATGKVVGLEALARWNDEELGAVNPAEFIPVAEDTGLIHRLGRFALAEAIRALSEHADLDIYVTVNVSPVQLRRPGFVQEVLSLLERDSVPHSHLTLEVTEGIFMDPNGVAAQTILDLAGHGLHIAIDDFGSGYSSLGYISRLPAKVLKVDRSLVCLNEEPRTRAVLRAITGLSADLGICVVMEGVEDSATAKSLMDIGATTAQGWLWSPAVPEKDLREVINQFGPPEPAAIPSPR